ncbi:unnamed protein product [Rotaria sp. Silwood2]|nr:unnamed protein product [Rotaria sp. Silwood2]CAF3033259.1 unnamed protein product [Rotaria sp. Silwood2]CAF4281731.1 unnamed protein product [Rotaria sp. Silwood2]CAF4374911.1 unnamed protein product [Rotaria sp. Silwood2]
MFSSNNNGFQLCKRLHRNRIISILSGVLFAIGWWIIIDMICQYPKQTDFNKVYLIIGVIATLALMFNCVSNSQVRGYDDGDNSLGQIGARFVLFISFLLVFGSFIASAWVLFGYYVTYKKDRLYPGLAIFVQNLAILISTLILKLGRKENLRY